jgi:transcriptional regulator with XRE-family HTH domain
VSQPSTEQIGRRIARYRKMNRWSARQLAENTDGALTRDTIANIENGRRSNISLEQFLAIALALRVPPVALLIDLQHPLEPSGIQFPGAAPAPLEQTAPQIAVAAWLSGQAGNPTTAAGRWVAEVTALLDDYLAIADTTEAGGARVRIGVARSKDDREQLAALQRGARAELMAFGVHLPTD